MTDGHLRNEESAVPDASLAHLSLGESIGNSSESSAMQNTPPTRSEHDSMKDFFRKQQAKSRHAHAA